MAELLFIASKLLHPRPAAAARRHRVSFGSVRAAARLSCMPTLQRHGHGRRRQRRGRCCTTELRAWRSPAAAEPSRGGGWRRRPSCRQWLRHGPSAKGGCGRYLLVHISAIEEQAVVYINWNAVVAACPEGGESN